MEFYMKKYIQNTAKLLMSGLLAAVFFISATISSQAYCDWTVSNAAVGEGYDMCINYIDWDGTVIQKWDFKRDNNGKLITVDKKYVPAGAQLDHNCNRAAKGFLGVDSDNPVPSIERGEKYTVNFVAGIRYLYEDSESDYDEDVSPLIGDNSINYVSIMDIEVYIDWDNDGKFEKTERVYKDDVSGNTYDHEAVIEVPSTATPGIVRMRVVSDYCNISDNAGNPVYKLDACNTIFGEAREYELEIARSPYDAALAEIVKPAPGVSISPGLQDVIVQLRNDGTVDMTSCTIEWDVNGQANTYNWTGTLAPGASEDVTLGNYNFKSMGKVTSYTVTAKVSKPNGKPDDMTDNDKVSEKYGLPLAPDTYYIGSMKDFANIVEAAEYLTDMGVTGSGEYKFYITPGNYDGQFVVDGSGFDHEDVKFLFAKNPEEDGSVKITHTIANFGKVNFVGQFNDIDFVTIENVEFTVIDPNNLVGRILDINGECGNFTINKCKFNGVENALQGWYYDCILIDDLDNVGNDITIFKNTFNDGGIGYFCNDMTEDGNRKNVTISNNKFNRFTTAAINTNSVKNTVIDNNTMLAQANALYAIYSIDGTTISNNSISGFIGTEVDNDDGTFSLPSTAILVAHVNIDEPAYIMNNTINGSEGIKGIYVQNIYGGKISENHIDITNTNGALAYGIQLNQNKYDNSIEEASVTVDENVFNMQNGHGMFFVDALVTMGGNTFFTEDNGAYGVTAGAYLRNCDAFLAANEVITNDVGFYNEGSTLTCVYNSIQATGANQAFYHGGTATGTSVYYRNQIANTGTGFAFLIKDTENPFIADENNYYTVGTDGVLGVYNDANITSLAEAGEVFGLNSRSENPYFVNDESCIISRYNPNMYFTYPISDINDNLTWPAEYKDKFEQMTINGKSRDGSYYIGAYNVYPKVRLVRQSKELIGCSGEEDLSIYCSGKANAGASPMYRWYKDGMLLEGKTEYKLYFDEFDYLTSGVYTCEIYTPGVKTSILSEPIAVYALSEPEITTQPQDEIGAEIGKNYQFVIDAHYRGKVPPMYEHHFQWYYYDAQKKQRIALEDDAHFAGTKSTVLTLVNTQAEHFCTEGDYYFCEIDAHCGIVESNPFIISELPQITIIKQPTTITVCPDGEAFFYFDVEVPAGFDLKYEWQVDAQPIFDNDIYSGTDKAKLIIKDVSSLESKPYSCTVMIEGTAVSVQSDGADLIIKDELTIAPVEKEVSIVRGESGELEVNILTGTDIKHVTWMFKNGIIKEGDWVEGEDVANAELLKYNIVNAVEKQDNGTYICRVTNDCGDVETEIKVNVPLWDGTGNEGHTDVVEEYNGYKLYAATPNPTADIATIKFEMPETANAVITLTDANGRTVATVFNGLAGKGENNVEINALGLANGVYYYTIVSDSFTATQAIVISK